MIKTEITILINRKSDLDAVQQKVVDNNIRFPVYIFETENLFRIEFTSDYEEWELEKSILSCFPDYEFVTDPEKGRKEIRMQLVRYQSEGSTDDWGRPIENPLNETKYLIRKSASQPEEYNPRVKVLFGESEQDYFINIVEGINKRTDEKGFLLVDDFKTNNAGRDAEVLKDRLYKTTHDAFHSGYYKLQEIVEEDFKKHLQEKQKQLTALQKVPRKIVRDFITACNKSATGTILSLLDPDLVYEKRVRWQTQIQIEGFQQFEAYLKSADQDLFSKDFKIRSSWHISLPYIKIGVKFLPPVNGNEKEGQQLLQYREFSFRLKNDKIGAIVEEL